jgi:hypothetical protein
MADEEKSEKKIIIDEGWKQEAQKDKEVLKTQEEQAKEKGEDRPGRLGPLPKGDIPALVSMLTTQALFSLGLVQLEGEQPREPDLELARYNIDMLEALEEKTKGNLTEAEERGLKAALGQLRMGYVQMVNQVQSSGQ